MMEKILLVVFGMLVGGVWADEPGAQKSVDADLYGIADPTQRLAAIRAKWPNAGEVVSQWKMPEYEERFFEIDRLQDWCNEDKANRYKDFEGACREAIKMKIEPAIWYYNLACLLAFLEKPNDDVFEALEQAVAAGYNDVDHAIKDEDFKSVTNDVRFSRLCETMGVIGKAWNVPKAPLRADADKVELTEDNVYYVFNRSSFLCDIATTNECPIVYINKHKNHNDIPCDGLIVPKLTEEAVGAACGSVAMNMHFYCPNLKVGYVPTIVASNRALDDDRMNRSMSIPAALGFYDGALEARHNVIFNAIGIYTVAYDYGFDGIDRFAAHYPLCIAHIGGANESDKFVRLCRDIIRLVPSDMRDMAALCALNAIRQSQKCVKDLDDYMSSVAWRPVLSFADIDVEKALCLACKQTDAILPVPPRIESSASDPSREVPCTDIWDSAYDRSHMHQSSWNSSFVHRGAGKSQRYEVKVNANWNNGNGEFVWKVLQGDEKKVRFSPLDEKRSRMAIDVDWHDVFEVSLSDGSKVKSSRVDIGCFVVYNGAVSLPSIISVYFSPNETREYGLEGKLVSIDYAKRQLEGYCPELCPKGKWKDVFHWDETGGLTGWTRYRGEVTNEFTREGLVVVSRDSLGRPKGVRRDMYSTWMQKQGTIKSMNVDDGVWLSYCAIQSNHSKEDPQKTTLAWRYEYENDADLFGKPSPIAPVPFRYRPELCLRADFSEDCGFRLPLLDQMDLGYCAYAGCRQGVVEWFDRATELVREDSRFALRAKGLKQPDVLKKMKFCKWSPSTNDVWKVDLRETEKKWQRWLKELGDGVYRCCTKKGVWLSVNNTYKQVNASLEKEAYALLDKEYRRCDYSVVEKMMSSNTATNEWTKTQIVEKGYMQYGTLPKGKEYTLAMWRITGDICLGIRTWHYAPKWSREYFFCKEDVATGQSLTFDFLNELPSRAIGNAIMGADAGDADALNNVAVLYYGGVLNPCQYDESSVLTLLKMAARKGNATAIYNVGVLFENRGEMDKAKIAYETAKKLQGE